MLGIELAGSLALAATAMRTEIELPGARHYLGRLRRDVYAVLATVRGLDPGRFAGVAPTIRAFAALLGVSGVLVTLRADYAVHLVALPAPLGFEGRRIGRDAPADAVQHRAGRDPPALRVEAHALTPNREPNP